MAHLKFNISIDKSKIISNKNLKKLRSFEKIEKTWDKKLVSFVVCGWRGGHWMMKQIEVKSNEVGAESEMMIKQSIMAGGQIR